MSRRTSIQVLAGIVLGVFALGLWSSGVPVEAGWLRFYSAAVLVAASAWAAWDRWLWRLPVFGRSPIAPPSMHGTWKGTVTSLWEDPSTGVRPDPKPAYLVIRQTASAVSVVMLTDEVSSWSMLAAVERSAGRATLAYLYLARPDVTVEDRSRMHHGSAVLDISGSPATRLRGRYWTDRDSRGELDFTARVTSVAADVTEAAQLFAEAP